MHFTKSILTVATASSFVHAGLVVRQVEPTVVEPAPLGGPGSSNGGDCPAIWTEIGAALIPSFFNTSIGQCTALARQAIRAAFHDCGAWNLTLGETGGCDGSLINAQEVFTRSEDDGMQEVSMLYQALVIQFDNLITTADIIQFGASSAVQLCPLGPTVQTFVGRKDSFIPAPPNLLPLPSQSAEFLNTLFAAKGITPPTLAALLGAHTVSQQFFVNTTFAGQAQDDTPGIWDVNFYANTFDPVPGTFVFQSDTVLSQDGLVGPEFKGFVGNQGKWQGAFAKAFTELSLLGVPGGSTNLVDCTNALPVAP